MRRTWYFRVAPPTLLMKKIRVYSYDWQTATFFYWTCLYSLKKEDVLERRLRGIYVAENL